MTKQTGATILVEALCRHRVRHIFGYPGGAVLPLYDELYRNRHRLEHILCAHEQQAVHAADGYARVSGTPGVVAATSGPGAANLVTGIATAFLDSVPLVVITGNVGTSLLGKDSFQELDICSITRGIVKHNFSVSSVKELSGIIDAAFFIASDGRKGPVLVDIPKSIQTDLCAPEEFTSPLIFSRSRPRADLSAVVRALGEAERPLIYAGGGIISAGAWRELAELAERIDAPVTFTMMGLGAMPSGHFRNAGMCGMHGTKESAELLKNCDLLLALGVRFSDRAVGDTEKFRKGKRIIQMDIDHSEINKNVPVDTGIRGDLKELLSQLLELLPESRHPQWQLPSGAVPEKVQKEDALLTPETLLRTAAKYCTSDTVIATDVGQHQMWTMNYFPFQSPRRLLTSGGLGTMGFGLGAAIGGSIASGRKPAFLFTGDGSLGMSLQELATAVSQELPLVILVFNNNALGMVRQWQTMFYGGRYSETSLNRRTDLPAVAKAFGAEGMKITTVKELESALQSLPARGPVLLDCRIHEDEFALPMIPPGGSVEDMITSKKEL